MDLSLLERFEKDNIVVENGLKVAPNNNRNSDLQIHRSNFDMVSF